MKIWENASGKMQRCMEKISPAIARDLTENNAARLAKYNLVARPIHPALVRQYMSAIKRDEWGSMVAAIHLAPNGAVLNGQHRLMAVIQADMTVEMDVVKNAPLSYYNKFDTGHRTPRDGLTIKQATHTKVKSSLLPMLAAYFDGTLATYRVNDIPQSVIDELDSQYNEELEEAIQFSAGAEFKRVFVAFLYLILSQAGHLNKCLMFLQQFKDGSNAERTSPALQMRRKIKKYSRNANNKELLAKMFFVINAVIDDRRVNTLKPDWSFRLSDGVRRAR